MFCTKCGNELREQDRFCSGCGVLNTRGFVSLHSEARLTRPMSEAKIAGVCAGFARYVGVDATLIRIIWAALMLSGFGIVAYIVAWILMPKDHVTVIATVSPLPRANPGA
jgi:phage shock protein C